MKYCLSLICGLLLSSLAYSQADTTQKFDPSTRNSAVQEKKPYVIMISIDGFRYDYAERHNAEHLKALGEAGVHATSMIPSYPSITFPNHYTLVTGLYPAHHGLVQNYFYDRNFKASYSYKSKTATEGKWYGGIPLWVLAERQQMLSASSYWVGSEADVQGQYPTYYYKYNEQIGINDRIQTVVNWLKQPAERRPHLITFYFPEVDHQGHKYGPDAPETDKAVHFVDSAIYELTKAVKTTGLDVNFVVVSDHGMTNVNREHTPVTPSIALDTTKFIRADEGELIHLYAKKPEYIQPAYDEIKAQAKGYQVYLRSDIPAAWHYGAKDDWHNRIGDILLVANWPTAFNNYKGKLNPGAHGYDPAVVKDMHAIFYAWGPNFKKNLTIPAFKNVDIYPMIVALLGLENKDKIDGTNELADKVLANKK
ncbi:alkaline phosphatase family protein [Mucilaginibacter agri]|uniref:Alkaline phosphatase family protein n=1 Tax=Mucilaginibacter agri TaxID=2695265 RepID=A0A965ZF55_9SPHI|nr:ectonucleotide pyrophosphatase/phosphodiesterase [Mucilaginibacter agri]NCD69919.1 alkaline phosphatase family protein [Mucilaginibacter agri]